MELNEILKVKIQGQCYLVNDEMTVPRANGNRHYELIKQWLVAGNIPESEFTEEQLDAQRISQIKAKASELILAKYSIIWQLNHPRTDSTYDNDYAWIDSIRAISNIAEANGTNVGDVQWQ